MHRWSLCSVRCSGCYGGDRRFCLTGMLFFILGFLFRILVGLCIIIGICHYGRSDGFICLHLICIYFLCRGCQDHALPVRKFICFI